MACERLAVGLREQGYETVVLVGTTGELSDRLDSLRISWSLYPALMRDKWHPIRYLSALRNVKRQIHSWRPDIIHSNDLPTHQLISQAASSFDVKTVCHHRFVYSSKSIDWMNSSRANRHLYVSNYLRNDLESKSAGLVDDGGEALYDGLPIPELLADEDRSKARQKCFRENDKFHVLFAGQIVERKGVQELMEAWAMLPQHIKAKARLTLIGDDIQNQGAYRKKMERYAKDQQLDCHFAGFQQSVDDWIIASDLVVVPSRVEPLGNATLEAMALGRPVIGSRCGGIPEMIVHEQTGLLVPPESPTELSQALARLIESPEVCVQFGRLGHQRCKEIFSLEKHVQSVVGVYDALLAS